MYLQGPLALSLLFAGLQPTPPSPPTPGEELTAASTAPSRGRPPEPRWRGNGLIATAGIFGALGLGLNIARVAVAARACDDLRYDEASMALAGTEACIGGGSALGGLALGSLVTNTAAFAFSAGAGAKRGRWSAHRTAFSGAPERRARLQIGLGAGLMSAGLLGYLAVRVASYTDLLGQQTCSERHPIDDVFDPAARANIGPFSTCMGHRLGGYLGGIMVGQTLAVVGVGLLAHGAAYNHDRKLMRYIAAGNLRLAPNFGRGQLGLAITGRF